MSFHARVHTRKNENNRCLPSLVTSEVVTLKYVFLFDLYSRIQITQRPYGPVSVIMIIRANGGRNIWETNGMACYSFGSCSRLNASYPEISKMRKEHIRSRDRHNPIIPPYPRVSSAIFNVPETTLSIKGREARNPKEFQGGPIYFSLRLLV